MDTSSLHFVDSTLSQYRNELLFHPRKKLPAKDVNDALRRLLEITGVQGKVRDTLTTHLNDRCGYARDLSKPTPSIAQVISAMEFALQSVYADQPVMEGGARA
jgi:hypothetical protein